MNLDQISTSQIGEVRLKLIQIVKNLLELVGQEKIYQSLES